MSTRRCATPIWAAAARSPGTRRGREGVSSGSAAVACATLSARAVADTLVLVRCLTRAPLPGRRRTRARLTPTPPRAARLSAGPPAPAACRRIICLGRRRLWGWVQPAWPPRGPAAWAARRRPCRPPRPRLPARRRRARAGPTCRRSQLRAALLRRCHRAPQARRLRPPRRRGRPSQRAPPRRSRQPRPRRPLLRPMQRGLRIHCRRQPRPHRRPRRCSHRCAHRLLRLRRR
jgi:hypothetical protein